ncbi:endonuclease/exonuclease/phosphatase family protein [Solitalea lacus]|uniref:endonuclease/exonuclease/phosphatase family protein n=1 Tax=Solitalea lacus TaxID=2911172 RepID=UPI001ED9E14A|nr:endonuclease/exonuclease/phosphatase family protein [Solitalea lacus]UKJ06809.1 endonuclease/exonuclease/phosphatase family protein [Solitalea lacus]
MIIKKQISFIFLLSGILLTTSVFAQTAIYQHSFNADPSYNTIKSLNGSALDLSASASQRNVLKMPYALHNNKQSFSIVLWVKAAQNLQSNYEIIRAVKEENKKQFGWSIGAQANGAWYWKISDSNTSYDYNPTPQRQSIKDQQWHLLAFTYDTDKKESRLYYDGLNVAIYYTPGLDSVNVADELHIGGKPSGDIGEWDTFNGCIDEVKVFDQILPSTYFINEYAKCYSSGKKEAEMHVIGTFKVMNYNIWHGGNETGKEVGVQRIVDVIKSSGADIVSMQETYGSGAKIADALGFYFYLRSTNLSIMSRYPIEETADGYEPFYNGGAYLRLAKNKRILFFTNWLNYPFDYWEMIEKGKPIDTADWQRQQDKVNAQRLRNILQKIEPYVSQTAIPVIFCGDFNTGSHLDYTEATRHLNSGYVINFPASNVMQKAGFIDSFRELYPDPLKDRGITWSPQFPKAFKDRIDYIYYKGHQLKAIKSFVIDKHPVKYPSDHAAMVTEFKFKD